MKQTFFESFQKLLSQNLAKYLPQSGECEPLTSIVCTKIYETIYQTVVYVLENSEVKISNESVNYVSQQYYDGVLINGNQELDPNIFEKRAKLDNVCNKDLLVIASLLDGTDFKYPVLEVLKRRN